MTGRVLGSRNRWVAVAVVFGVAEELFAVFAHHVPPQIKVGGIVGGRDACRLEYPGWHDAEHASRDRYVFHASPQEHECVAGAATPDGERANREEQRI